MNQIKEDIKTLNEEFLKFSGAWEYNEGDYGCITIAEHELQLVKNISKRYPDFKYSYNPSKFDKNSKWYADEWYAEDPFDIEDFENENVNENNYGKVDAVASDFKDELIKFLKAKIEE